MIKSHLLYRLSYRGDLRDDAELIGDIHVGSSIVSDNRPVARVRSARTRAVTLFRWEKPKHVQQVRGA